MKETQEILEPLVEWIEASGTDAEQQRFIWLWWNFLWKNLPLNYERQLLYDRCCQAKGAHPWLVHMMSGRYHHWVAFEYRGSGWADTITDHNGKLVQERIELAALHLSYAWKLQPTSVEPAAEMLAVAKASHATRFGTIHTWFQRGINAQIDDQALYDNYLWALEPRWVGSAEEMLAFGDKCVDSGRFDTHIPQRALDALARIQWNDLGLSARVTDRPDAQRLLQKYCDRFWEAVDRSQKGNEDPKLVLPNNPATRALAAGLCLQASRFGDARRLLDGLADPVTHASSEFERLLEPADLGVSAALASAENESLIRVTMQHLRKDSDHGVANEEVEQLKMKLTEFRAASQNPWAVRFCEHALAIMARAQQFRAGEWVPLNFQNKAAGWNIRAKEWELLDDQTIQLANFKTNGDFVQADSLNRFPLPYCVEFEVEHLTPKARPEFSGSRRDAGILGTVGAVIGGQDRMAVESLTLHTRQIGVNPMMNTLEIIGNTDSNVSRGTMLGRAGPHRLVLKLWPGWYSCYVNGNLLIDNSDSSFLPSPDLGFGSGSVFDWKEQGAVKIRNIRIRRLPYGSPPVVRGGDDVGSLNDRVDYYQQVLNFDPADRWAKFFLGESLESLKRYDEALPLLEESITQLPHALRQNLSALSLAGCYEGKRDFAKALKAYRQQHEATPNNIPTLARLSLILSSAPDEQLRDAAAATDLANQACQLQANDPSKNWQALFARASALANLGEFSKAVSAIDEASMAAKESESKTFLQTRRKEFSELKPFRQ